MKKINAYRLCTSTTKKEVAIILSNSLSPLGRLTVVLFALSCAITGQAQTSNNKITTVAMQPKFNPNNQIIELHTTPPEPENTKNDVLNALGDLLFAATPAIKQASSNQKNGVGYFDLGIGGQYKLEAKFEKFKLGCAKGLDRCDLDIDGLHLKSNQPCVDNTPCYATVSEPSLQFAIQNPSSLTSRKLIGLRLLLDSTNGAMEGGIISTKPNGINNYSGYIPIKPIKGMIKTTDGYYGTGKYGEAPLYGVFSADPLACTRNCDNPILFHSVPDKTKGFYVPPLEISFATPAFELNGTRISALEIKNIKARLPDIQISPETSSAMLEIPDSERVCAIGFVCVKTATIYPNLLIKNLLANITFYENLGFVHRINMNHVPFYVGIQRQPIHWPNAIETANTGWWLSFQAPIDMDDIYSLEPMDAGIAFPALSTLLSENLKQNPFKLSTLNGVTAYTGSFIKKDLGTLNVKGQLDITLKDIPITDKKNW